MQGFQPPAQRGLAHRATNPQHLADGGQVGFGARGLSGLRDLIPKMAAMGYPQATPAPAPAVAAAPATDTRAAQLQAMIPRMEAMGYKQQQPQYLAKGGLVRGPGTGTSDSIATEAEPGTFIMPADSTAEIGPSALEKMGTVPVRLSNGEFEVPPEQVMAIGAAVLKAMKDATHTPVNGVDGGQTDAEVAEARGFAPGAAERMAQAPEQLYADGGVVAGFDQMERERLGRRNAALAVAQQEAAASQAQSDSLAMERERQRQAQGGMAQGFADGGVVDPTRPNSFGDAAAVARDPGTTQVRTSATDTFGTTAPAPAPAPAQPALGSNLAAATRMTGFSDPRSTTYDPNPYAASNAAKLAASGQSSRATVEAGMPPAPAPATARNSFGDAAAATQDASVTQVASGFQPNRGTVSTVPARSLSSVASAPGTAQPAVGTQSAAQRMASAPAPAAPMGWADRLGAMPNQPRRYADGGLVEDRAVFGFYPQLTDHGKTTRATADQLRQGVQATGPSTFEPAAQVTPPPAPPTPQRMNSLTDPRSLAYAGTAPPAAPASTGNGALSRAATMMSAAATPSPAPLPVGEVSAQNQGAAESLSRRGAASAMAALPSAASSVQAPIVRHSGNDWQARKDLENARTSALSIMNRPEWSNAGMNRFRGGHGGESPDVSAYQAMLSNDLALRAAQPGMDQAAMREQGDMQRAGLQAAASAAEGAANRQNDMARTLVTERGNNSRAGITALAGLEEARLKAGAAGPKLTEDQAKSAGYALRMDNALKLINEIGAKNPGATRPGVGTSLINSLPEGVANFIRPEDRQRVEAAQLDALDAALTLNTGAAYTREQLQGLSRSYFPQPGDDPKTIAEKQARLASQVETARLRAGPSGSAMADAAQAKGAQAAASQPSKPPAMDALPTEGIAVGRRIRDNQTGQVLTWDGSQWKGA
jgi:hypothetical protein